MSNAERTTDFVRDLGNAARENPAAAALIGMGIAWMLFGGRSFPKVGSMFEQIPDVARSSIGAATDGLKSTFDRASSGVAGIGEAVGSATSSAYSQAADYTGRVSENARPLAKLGVEAFDDTRAALAKTFEAQPLALGVVGLAIGAGIAAALPTTDIEVAYLGETSGRVQDMAMDVAGGQINDAVDKVQDVVKAVTTEAEKQGLTGEGLGSLVGDLSEKVTRVAKSATSGSGAA